MKLILPGKNAKVEKDKAQIVVKGKKINKDH